MQFVLGVLIAIALVATLVSLVLGSIFGDDPMLGLWARRWQSWGQRHLRGGKID
jgi:hypothetical protein